MKKNYVQNSRFFLAPTHTFSVTNSVERLRNKYIIFIQARKNDLNIPLVYKTLIKYIFN